MPEPIYTVAESAQEKRLRKSVLKKKAAETPPPALAPVRKTPVLRVREGAKPVEEGKDFLAGAGDFIGGVANAMGKTPLGFIPGAPTVGQTLGALDTGYSAAGEAGLRVLEGKNPLAAPKFGPSNAEGFSYPTDREPNPLERVQGMAESFRKRPGTEQAFVDLAFSAPVGEIAQGARAGAKAAAKGAKATTKAVKEAAPSRIAALKSERGAIGPGGAGESARFTLPRDLAGAKPRFKTSEIAFESDMDKTLYILAQDTKSKSDAKYLKAAMQATGLDEQALRTQGRTVRERVKAAAKATPEGEAIVVPSGVGMPKPAPAPQPQAAPVQAATTPQTSPSMTRQEAAKALRDRGVAFDDMDVALNDLSAISTLRNGAVTDDVLDLVAQRHVEAAPQAAPVEARRVPLYARPEAQAKARELLPQPKGAGGQPPSQPPTPPTGTPPELPSGRKPGGPRPSAPPTGVPFGPPDPLVQARAAWASAPDSVLDKARAEITQAKWIDSNNILEGVEKATGVPAHKLAQAVNGAWGAGEDVVALRYKPAFQGMSAQDVRHLTDYMVLMTEQDVKARGGLFARVPSKTDPFNTVTQMEKRLGAERMARIKQAAEQLWEADDTEVLEYLRKNGILSDEAVGNIRAANPHYFPLAREDFQDAIGKRLAGDKAVGNVSSSGLKERSIGGSERKLDNPLGRYMGSVIKARVLVARNEAAKGIVKALREQEKLTGEKLVTYIDEAAERQMRGRATGRAAGETRYAAEAERSAQWDTITYMEKGEPVVAQVPAEYALVAKGLDAETTGALGRVAQVLNAPIRAGAVAFNTTFIPRNMVRDLQTLWQIEGKTALPQYLAGWKAAILKNQDFHDAAEANALMSGIVENMRGKDAAKLAARMGGVSVKSPGDALLFVPRLIEAVNMAAERAPRIATFKALRAQGLTELEAAIRARNVTVDFAKSGTSMRVVNQVVPFANASLQGSVNMLGAIKRNPKRALGIAAAPFLTATLLTRTNNMRFESARQIPDYEYTRYWPLVVAEGTRKDGTTFPIYARVPKGTFAGFVSAPVEAMLTYASKTNDKSAVELLFDAVMAQTETASPVSLSVGGVLPSPLQVGVSETLGTDLYSKQEIVPGRRQNLLPEQQFDDDTLTLALALGQQFKVSPDKIDFALRRTAGGAGEQASWLAGLGLEALGYRRPEPYGAARDAQQDLSATEQTLGTPLLRPFVGTRSTGDERRGYDALNKATEETKRAFSQLPLTQRLGVQLGQVGDSIDLTPGRAGGSITLTPEERAMYQRITGETVISGIRPYMAQVENSTASDEKKRKAIMDRMDALRETARARFLEWRRAQGQGAPSPATGQRTRTRPATAPRIRVREGAVAR